MAGVSDEDSGLTDSTNSGYVRFNVGGCLYYSTVGMLKQHDTMLKAMFSGRTPILKDAEGWVLIDRDGKHFGTILNYLRDGKAALPDTKQGLGELLAEAKYYLIQPLVDEVEKSLQAYSAPLEYKPRCLIPYITSSKDEQHIIANAKKPVVKFLCNRQNNKYSYTNNSDDNLLRNIESFDKLSVRFSERILFIKDTVGGGTSEICCWSFYGNNQKVAEVSCTSIVYGTDKKHTKVEFPEARIYEETLNLTLYESPERSRQSALKMDVSAIDLMDEDLGQCTLTVATSGTASSSSHVCGGGVAGAVSNFVHRFSPATEEDVGGAAGPGVAGAAAAAPVGAHVMSGAAGGPSTGGGATAAANSSHASNSATRHHRRNK